MKQHFFVGTYSKNGIYDLTFDSGDISENNLITEFSNCSYLCKHSDMLYGIVEHSLTPIKTDGHLFSMSYDLIFHNSIFLNGKSPCYIFFDSENYLLYISNYVDGSIEIYSVNNNLCINKLVLYKKYTSHSHIHYISIHNQILYISDLGDDKIYAYKVHFDLLNNNLKLEEISYFKFEKNSSPRHLAFDDKYTYVLTETSCELYKLSFSIENGFKFEEKRSIIPSSVSKTETDTGCALKISNDKKYLYATLRGHNQICVFDIQNELRMIQNISCNGETPRDLAFDKTNNYLLCANQNSDNISVFSRDKKTGCLTFLNTHFIKSPACILFL